MATVYKRGRLWWGRWYSADGKRVSKSTGTEKKREAERIAADYEAKDRKAGKQDDQVASAYQNIVEAAALAATKGKLTSKRAEELLTELRRRADPSFRIIGLEDYLAEWCEHKTHHVAGSTSAGYLDMKRRFAAALGPAVMRAPIGDLTESHIKKAIVKMKAGLKAATVNLDLRALRQALKQAMEDELILRNPATKVKTLPENDSSERAPFDADEWRAMIDHKETTDEWRGMILFGGHTGLRLGDIAQLGDEHLEGSELVIRPKKTKRQKKTIRVPLTPPLLAWLKDKKGKGCFFPTLSRTATPTLSMQFKAIMKRAGVPDKVTMPGGIAGTRSFHSLRHSFASWLANADIHADVRQKLTGHSSAGVHAKYTHHDEALRKAITVLPDLTGTGD